MSQTTTANGIDLAAAAQLLARLQASGVTMEQLMNGTDSKPAAGPQTFENEVFWEENEYKGTMLFKVCRPFVKNGERKIDWMFNAGTVKWGQLLGTDRDGDSILMALVGYLADHHADFVSVSKGIDLFVQKYLEWRAALADELEQVGQADAAQAVREEADAILGGVPEKGMVKTFEGRDAFLHKLTRARLTWLVVELHDVTYENVCGVNGLQLDPDKEFSADTPDELAQAFDRYGLVPPAADGGDDEEEGGRPDPDGTHTNHCVSCEQFFTDGDFVRYFDKCVGCAESPD